MTIDIRVVVTAKRARATVIYIDHDQPRLCGVALDQSQNIWGVLLPPEDWSEAESEGVPD